MPEALIELKDKAGGQAVGGGGRLTTNFFSPNNNKGFFIKTNLARGN